MPFPTALLTHSEGRGFRQRKINQIFPLPFFSPQSWQQRHETFPGISPVYTGPAKPVV